MRIAIDARAYFQRTGIARYTRGLVHALVEQNTRDDYLLLISNHHRAEEVSIRDPRVTVLVSDAPWLGGRDERQQLAREVRRWHADLFHALFPPMALSGIPSLVTLFDVTPLSHPQFHQPAIVRAFRAAARQALPRAARILPISRATAEQLWLREPATRRRTRVVGAGLPQALLRKPPTARRGGVLFVGTVEPRKNVPLVVQAARRLAERGYRGTVTIAGRSGWGGYDVARDLRGVPRTRYLGYVDDTRLRALYRRAAIFLYPSAVEGFGLPVLEAMAQGALPLISADPALQEVVRDRSLVIDPADPDHVANAILHWSANAGRRQRKAAKLARRARTFTWSRVARDVARVYGEFR